MQRKNGISLVVLVITIIVMIILAGTVVISLSDTGIFDRAEEAVNKTNIANINEMLSADAYLKLYTSGNMNKYTDEELQEYYENYMSNNNYTIPNGYVLRVNSSKVGILIEEIDPTIMKGAGTSSNPYQINCIEHMVLIAQYVDAGTTGSGMYFKLMRSLDFKDNLSYANALDIEQFGDYNGDGTTNGIKTELTTGRGWRPIGYNATIPDASDATSINGFSFAGKYFAGYFNGNNNEIKNLYINETNTAERNVAYALFATAGSVSNLTVTGNITASTSNTAGYIYVGGIVGCTVYDITNCDSHVNITSLNNNCEGYYVGGISGLMTDAKLRDVKNYGNIQTSGITSYSWNDGTGGIAGNVTGDGYIATAGIIDRCENYGDVVSDGHASGGIGYSIYATVQNFANFGDVRGKYAGGILGQTYHGWFLNCYNVGIVSSEQEESGSYSFDMMKNCYNVGATEYGFWSAGIPSGTWGGTCYYVEDKAKYSSGGTAIADYTTLLNTLNTYIEEQMDASQPEFYPAYLSTWKMGKAGYPVFDWQE